MFQRLYSVTVVLSVMAANWGGRDVRVDRICHQFFSLLRFLCVEFVQEQVFLFRGINTRKGVF